MLFLLDGQKKTWKYPLFIPREPAHLNDVATAHLWDMVILTDEGYDHFMGIVAAITAQRIEVLADDEDV